MRNLLTITVCMLSFQFTCKHKKVEIVKTELYQYVSDKGYVDNIQISQTEDSLISGKYSGAYLNPDSSVIYFYSKFIAKKTNSSYDIVFDLSNFVFALNPISLNEEKSNKGPGITNVPFIFQSPITCLGEFTDNKLIIKRITQLQTMSGSETLIFKKVNKGQ